MDFDYDKLTLDLPTKKQIINEVTERFYTCERMAHKFLDQFSIVKNSQANDELTKLAFLTIERKVDETVSRFKKMEKKLKEVDFNAEEVYFKVGLRYVRSECDYLFNEINTFSGNLSTISKQINNPIFTLACEEVSTSLGDWMRSSYQISYCCPPR